MSDGELVRFVDHNLQAGRHHPDFRVPDQLFTQLASHPFVFEKMPTKDLVKLFVALNEFRDSRLDGLCERVNAALNKRIGEMELSSPVAHIGATPAGVRAAFVDRLSFLKEDVETLSLLAKESSNLPRDRKTELTAAIAKAIPKTIVKLVEVMAQGTEEKSPRIISKAVDLARLAHAILVGLIPPDTALHDADKLLALEVLMTGALKTVSAVKLGELVMVLNGKAASSGRIALVDEKNVVFVALSRQDDGTDNPKNTETLNLQLFRNAVDARARESKLHKLNQQREVAQQHVIARELFGDDGNALPPESAIGGTSKASRDYFALLSTFDLIKSLPSMTQQVAEQLAGPLQTILRVNAMGERVGPYDEELYSLNLESLKLLPAEQRPAAFCALLEPARIQAQQRIVSEVSAKRKAKELKDRTQAISRAGLDKRKAAGVKVDVEERQKRFERDEKVKKLFEAAEKKPSPDPASE
jgi:hypothetical protein